MTPRRIVTGVLLAFVVASVGYLVFKETRGGGAAASGAVQQKAGDRVVAFYFHGTVRCPTCRKIESYTREAIETGFAAELASGKLEWHAVNVEDPGNEHYVQDYQIAGKTVVLVEFRGGAQARWKKLDRTWELVRDRFQFVQYVQAETRDYLGAL